MRHYNYTAHMYNLRYREEQNLKIKAAIENLEFNSQVSILDLGCGTGLLLSKIHEMAKMIVAIDMSKCMLKETDPFVKRSRCIHFILADADYIPLRNSYFDMVFAITLLQNMPNPHDTLQEVKRITKNDALIIVTGLKNYFSEHSFVKLLKDADLKLKWLKTDDGLKCYIATCRSKAPPVSNVQ
ncbi:MAG: class I SAM-dependent methyltransferase [Candidatus Bathyarchaeia archaeon]